jgi:hypothetical protein
MTRTIRSFDCHLVITAVVVVSDKFDGKEFFLGAEFQLLLLLGFLESDLATGPRVNLMLKAHS